MTHFLFSKTVKAILLFCITIEFQLSFSSLQVLADNIKPKEPLDVTSRQTEVEKTNQNLVESTGDEDKARLNEKFVSKNVFNLSHRALTDSEIRVLDKGLNFVPTPGKLDQFQIENGLERLGREIRSKIHFKTKSTVAFSEKAAFRVLSKSTPPIRGIQLKMYLSETEERLLSINQSEKSYSNLKKDERDALHFFMSDDELIIKPADKGSAVVVWSNYDYLLVAKSQLHNTKVYEKWSGNPLQKVNNENKSVLRYKFNRKEIDKKLMDYLFIKRPLLGRFYLLSKIHKRTSNVPGQPVISNNGTATENISAFVDFHLKTIIPTVPHILEGT